MNRLKANRQILCHIATYIEQNPEQRFNQILYNLGMTEEDQTTNSNDILDYDKESIDIMDALEIRAEALNAVKEI